MPTVQNFSGPWPGTPPVDPPRGGGDDGGMESRLRTLEADVAVIRATAATKHDLAEFGKEWRAEMASLRAELAAFRAAVQAGIAALRSEMQAEIAVLRSEMQAEIAVLRSEMQAEIAALRSDMQAEIAALRADMQAQMAVLRVELHRELNQQTWKLFGVCALLIGATFFVARNVMPPADFMAAARAAAVSTAAPGHPASHP